MKKTSLDSHTDFDRGAASIKRWTHSQLESGAEG
jgi:hypothetical protein